MLISSCEERHIEHKYLQHFNHVEARDEMGDSRYARDEDCCIFHLDLAIILITNCCSSLFSHPSLLHILIAKNRD